MNDILLWIYGEAAAGSSPGVEEFIRPTFISAGIFTLGFFMSDNVAPASTFVSPITGGSPFLTNSYNPVSV